MRKVLIVIDMQNDFIDGSLGTPEAQAIIPNVKKKIEEYRKRGNEVMFTRDTHSTNYLDTNEGQHLPIEHCIVGTDGWNIHKDLVVSPYEYVVNKGTFGFTDWYDWIYWKDRSVDLELELVGLCTDICVVSNALILKAIYPEANITVDASCCAGVTPESHSAALTTMKMCQINVIGE